MRLSMMVALATLVVVTVGLLLAGCSDDPEPITGTPAANDRLDETSDEPGAAPGATAEVGIDGFAFVPAELVVDAGSTVVWTNRDDTPHTVTTQDPSIAVVDSGEIPAGESFEHTFLEPGTHVYGCSLHPDMEGIVVVE